MSIEQVTDELELEVALRRFARAWAAGDAALLETMLAPDYTHVDPTGEFFDRDDWLDDTRDRAGRGTTVSFHNVTVRRHGDVAIVTGVIVMGGGGILAVDDPRDLSLRFTQVWSRMDGRWLRDAFHGTPIGEGPDR